MPQGAGRRNCAAYQALETGGARRLRSESFFSAPQFRRAPRRSRISSWSLPCQLPSRSSWHGGLDAVEPAVIAVRPASERAAAAWLQLRHALWPDHPEAEHREEIDRFFAGDAREPLAVLLAEDETRCPVGFAELSVRAYAEGCRTDRVAYLEGWFVVRRGVGTRAGLPGVCLRRRAGQRGQRRRPPRAGV